jgi:hypothetical protein
MKTLKLGIDIKGIEKELKGTPEEKLPGRDICIMVIKNIVMNWAQTTQRGLTEEERRIYYKISDAFDKAIAEKLDSIEIEDNHMGLIRKAFREGKFTPSPLLRRVEEALAETKDR